ncbi:MAG: HAD family hydrolase [Acidimicrobiales bacterium]
MVATDLDGTLLRPGGRVSTRTGRAVQEARAAGIAVIPATARPPSSMSAACAGAPVGPLAVCSNGSILWDVEARRLLEHHSLPAASAARAVMAVREALPGSRFACEVLDSFRYEVGMLEPEQALAWGIEEEPVGDILDHLAGEVTKVCCWHPHLDGPEMADLVRSIAAGSAEVTSAGAGWALAGAPGVTKASTLARACERLGVSPPAVLAVGDEHNDLAMLAWAGHGVAVANARPEVLAVADETVPANLDDGVAVLLEWLVEARRAGPSGTPRPPGRGGRQRASPASTPPG